MPVIVRGDALSLLTGESLPFDLIATDPPYAFSGSGDEHAISATVAIVLRECAARLRAGGWLLVLCASSWRSTAYMAEAVRGLVEPVRVAQWHKPTARTRARTSGWAWQSVSVLACRKGKSLLPPSPLPDFIVAEPVMGGRRAELPREVAEWVVAPFAVPGGRMLDPFAGSGRLVEAASRLGMVAVGYEKNAKEVP